MIQRNDLFKQGRTEVYLYNYLCWVNIRLFEISITGKKFSSFQKFLIVMFFVAIIAYLVAGKLKLTHCKVFLIAK